MYLRKHTWGASFALVPDLDQEILHSRLEPDIIMGILEKGVNVYYIQEKCKLLWADGRLWCSNIAGDYFPSPLNLGRTLWPLQWLECSKSDTVLLPRLGHKRWYSLCWLLPPPTPHRYTHTAHLWKLATVLWGKRKHITTCSCSSLQLQLRSRPTTGINCQTCERAGLQRILLLSFQAVAAG